MPDPPGPLLTPDSWLLTMHTDFSHGHSTIHHVDPRLRILGAVALCIPMAVVQSIPALTVGVASGLALVIAARLSWRGLLRRLVVVNFFVLALWIVLPLASGGEAVAHVGGVALSRAGVVKALTITLKANGIFLTCLALLATIDPISLGHALHHLRVPDKLTHVLFFTVRYLDVLEQEAVRLRNAMRVRCFKPRVNRHSYRAFGHLAGMLLVNSYDRSERILAAMKCRGFRGHFYVLRHFTLSRRDAVFAVSVAGILAALVGMTWLIR